MEIEENLRRDFGREENLEKKRKQKKERILLEERIEGNESSKLGVTIFIDQYNPRVHPRRSSRDPQS